MLKYLGWIKKAIFIKNTLNNSKLIKELDRYPVDYKIYNEPICIFTGRYHKGRRIYKLDNDSLFEVETEKFIIEAGFLFDVETEKFIIEAGFLFDGWSIPWIADKFFDLRRDLVPALVHDWLFLHAGLHSVERETADKLLRQISIDRHNEVDESNICWFFVNLFSKRIWNKYKKMGKAERKIYWQKITGVEDEKA